MKNNSKIHEHQNHKERNVIRMVFLGAGSLGSLFGGSIALLSGKSEEIDVDVTFFCRQTHAEIIKKRGLTIKRENEQTIATNISAYTSLNEYLENINPVTPIDFLFLCTKAYDSRAALTEYKSLVQHCKRLVILQNGIGNEEIAEDFCPQSKIIRIVTSNGALLQEPGLVQHTGFGTTKIGAPGLIEKGETPSNDEWENLEKDMDLLAKLLDSTRLSGQKVKNIETICWEKIFVNIGINPFGALTRLPNGMLLNISELSKYMERAVREAIEVARKKGVALEEKDYVEIMFGVARKTAQNKNSMLQDILKGKPTEIEFINGRIVEYAKGLGIPVPINELLALLVRGLEQSS